MGMLLGLASVSQLQPELFPLSLAPDWEWGSSSSSLHGWEMGLPLARCCQTVYTTQKKCRGYQFSPVVVLAKMKQSAGWIAYAGVKLAPLVDSRGEDTEFVQHSWGF